MDKNELWDIAILNGYIARNANGNTRYTDAGFKLAKDFFKTDSAKRAGINIHDPVDVQVVILLIVEELVALGHVEADNG